MTLSIHSPDELIAAVPHLLGFNSEESMVFVPLHPDLPLARVDLPSTARQRDEVWGGFCLRAPAQGACAYSNICEYCPSFHASATSLPILAAQRVDAEALARDAEQRGWINEADRHPQVVARLDHLIDQAHTR